LTIHAKPNVGAVDSHAQIPKKYQAKQPAINQAKRKPEGFILPA